MSIPVIRGYLEQPNSKTLADYWDRPPSLAPELWPQTELQKITRTPTGWLTIAELFDRDHKHGARGCVLIAREAEPSALEEVRWLGMDLGTVEIFDKRGFVDGMTAADSDVRSEFFIEVRCPSGASHPVVEVAYPFLWYWDAFPTSSGWRYLNRAGRAQDLLRWELANDQWKVDVRALELRQFLAAYGRTAVVQVDHTIKIEGTAPIERIDDDFKNDWAHFDLHAQYEPYFGDRPVFSRICGQYLLAGQRNARRPRFEERRETTGYPDFIYKVVPATGMPETHTCDPEQLGTYFDRDNSRPHYLTAVCFRREVLQPYASEPNKYVVTATRLSCLDLWALSISHNSAGQIEVYLGDLGRDLPSEEWGHWLTHNVAPDGRTEEGRFRRDFLNQPTSSEDPVGELRHARQRANHISTALFGKPLWRSLSGDLEAEFNSLTGPLVDDPVALEKPVLVLTKVFIETIDPEALKAFVTAESGEKSLKLLRKFVSKLGPEKDPTQILHALQRYRSKIAHYSNSSRDKAATELGIAGLAPFNAFISIVTKLTKSLNELTALMEHAIEDNTHLLMAQCEKAVDISRGRL